MIRIIPPFNALCRCVQSSMFVKIKFKTKIGLNRYNCGLCFVSQQNSFFLFIASLRTGSNSYAGFLASKLLLKCAVQYNITNLQIFGNFLIIINWMGRSFKMESLTPTPVFEKIKKTEGVFINLSYKHIFSKLNTTADLSKKSLPLKRGTLGIVEMKDAMAPTNSPFLKFFRLIPFYIAGTSTRKGTEREELSGFSFRFLFQDNTDD